MKIHRLKLNKSRSRNSRRKLTVYNQLNRVHVIHVGDTPTCRLRLGAHSSMSRQCLGESLSLGKSLDKKYPPKDIKNHITAFEEKFGREITYPKFKWQKSFYDHIIRFHDDIMRKEKDWDGHYDYTVNNQIKHSLPEDWHYTSINYPELVDSMEK